MRGSIVVFAVLTSTAATVRAQDPVPTPDEQIAAAVLPLPEVLRAGAGVRGYADAATPVTLREGTNAIVCMGDRPGDDEFDVRCYNRDFLAVIDRRRELVRSGLEGAVAEERLSREVAEGSLPMPDHPTAGYRMLGPIAAYDPATGSFTDAIAKWQSVHFPYRTAEELGIPTEPERAMPYTGTLTRGEPSLSVTVVPDSGTDQLVGLAGRMAIEIAEDGAHSYAFDYMLPDTPREAVP